jgi:hypothetical protein
MIRGPPSVYGSCQFWNRIEIFGLAGRNQSRVHNIPIDLRHLKPMLKILLLLAAINLGKAFAGLKQAKKRKRDEGVSERHEGPNV